MAATLAVAACGSGADNVVGGGGSSDDGAVSTPGQWEPVPAGPLSARTASLGIWTGREVLVIGGHTAPCHPTASCELLEGAQFFDGAAYDPVARTWRTIAPAPETVDFASTAVLGDDVFLWTAGSEPPSLLRYSIAADTWDTVTVPAGMGATHQLLAVGDRLLAYSGHDEQGPFPDLLLDPLDGTVEELPDDPLPPSVGRTMAVAGEDLLLFANEIDPNPGVVPSLVRAARFRASTGTWERLTDSEQLFAGPLLVEGTLVTFPTGGTADGGQVNNWGRHYPFGGTYDVATDSWAGLPPLPTEWSTGAVGRAAAVYLGTSGSVLDVVTGSWLPMAPIPVDGDSATTAVRGVITAGADAFVFGGVRWDGLDAELLADAWLWHP